MTKLEVLIEVDVEVQEALTASGAAAASFQEGRRQCESLLPDVRGIDFRPAAKPVPMFSSSVADTGWQLQALTAFTSEESNDDLPSVTAVIPAQVEEQAVTELQQRSGVRVWPSSPIRFHPVDCPPFKPGVSVDDIRARLGVESVWETGARGGGVVVGVLDDGIDGSAYPVAGGFVRAGGQRPGGASVGSHGSMCAAGVLVAAPEVTLYDYPFMVPRSGGALVMLNAALEQRRLDGTPHVLSNSWGFYSVPSRESSPDHEVWDLEHPLHRKIREVVTSGAAVVFAAGNCGEPCSSGNCHDSSIGAGQSIHGPNSLAEVITVAAVNSEDDRIGYSSQGPGMFEQKKPDVAAYSHFFGNFGPGRPGGDSEQPFDSGTSAACPVAAGMVALLLSARPDLTPGQLQAALVEGARGSDAWSVDIGHGVVGAAASFAAITGAQSA